MNDQKRTILVFGNPDLPEDAGAVKLVPDLESAFPDVHFRVVDPNDLDLLEEKEIIVLDTVEGLKDVRWIEIEELAVTGEQMTTHDFDASTYLLLMKKINPDTDIRIIGVPMNGKTGDVLEDVKKHLKNICKMA